MLFQQHNSFKIEKLIFDYTASLEILNDEINSDKPMLLKGFGFFGFFSEMQFSQYSGLYVLHINDKFYGFLCETNLTKIPSEQDEMFFSQIVHLSPEILNSVLMELPNSHNYFKKYDADLPIETKYYDYESEFKLILNKEGESNISLYSSVQIDKKTNRFIFKTYPIANEVAREIHLKHMIDKRFSNIKS